MSTTPTVLAKLAATEICHEMGINFHSHAVRIAEIIDEHTRLPDMISALRSIHVGSATHKEGLRTAEDILNYVDS